MIRRLGTSKTHCVHRMTLRPFVPHNEIDDFRVNQKELHPDTEAIEDRDIFDGNLQPLSEKESGNEFQKPTEEINP